MDQKRNTLKKVSERSVIVALAPNSWTKPIVSSISLELIRIIKLIICMITFIVCSVTNSYASTLSKIETIDYIKEKFKTSGTGYRWGKLTYKGVKIVKFDSKSCQTIVDVTFDNGDPTNLVERLWFSPQNFDPNLTGFEPEDFGSVRMSFFCYERAYCVDYQYIKAPSNYKKEKDDQAHITFGIDNHKDALKVKNAFHHLSKICSANSDDPF